MVVRATGSGKATLLLISFGFETFGKNVFFTYLPLLIAFSYGETFYASVYRSLEYVGPAIFGYAVGSFVDRVDKQLIGFTSITSMFMISVIISTQRVSVFSSNLVFLMTIFSLCSYVLGNLRSTVVPILFESNKRMRANATLITVEQISLVLEPAAVAALLYLGEPKLGFAVLAVCFSISGIAYFGALSGYSEPQRPRTRLSFIEAVRTLVGNRELLLITLTVMGNNAFSGIFSLYIILYGVEAGLLSQGAAPLMLVVSGVLGAMAGVFHARCFRNTSPLYLAMVCAFGLSVGGLSLVVAPSICTLIIALATEGMLSVFLVVSAWTLRQQTTSQEVLGKITGITSMLFKAAMLFSLPVAGMLADRYSSRAAIALGSILVFCGGLPTLWIIFSRSRGVKGVDG